MDMHTHFLRDDTRLDGLRRACARRSARPAGTRRWSSKQQTIEDLKFDNYFKEIFLDSDTKIALISVGAVRDPAGLVPHQRADGRGARRR